MGAITPVGNDVDTFWNSLKQGTVGIGPITSFDTADYKVKLAAEVKDFDPKQYMDPKLPEEWSGSPSWLWPRQSRP